MSDSEIKRPGPGSYGAAWLRYARLRGHDNPFEAPPEPALLALEQLGLIERDPTSSGEHTHWRTTE
jgi:hypothetical protein